MNRVFRISFVYLSSIFTLTTSLTSIAGLTRVDGIADMQVNSTGTYMSPSSTVAPADYNLGLMQKVSANDLSGARVMIESGADVNQAQDGYGYTALGLSALFGYTELVKLLLECGAEPNMGHKAGTSPLSFAAPHGYLEIVDLLLENGADPNHADAQGFTPLIDAARNGHEGVVLALLDAKANPNAKSFKFKITALHIAAREGFHKIVKILLDRGASHTEIPSALSQAVENGHTEAASLLLSQLNTHPNALQVSHSLLYWPFFNWLMNPHRGLDTRMVEILLEKGASFKSHFEITDLIESAKRVNFAKVSLDENGKPTLCTSEGCSTLFLAAWEKNTRTVDALLMQGETFLSSLEIQTLILGSAQASLAAERIVPTCQLRFDAFNKFLYENSFGRGQVSPDSLNKLASGTPLNLDEQMILSIGLSTLKEHCNDEKAQEAMEVIRNKINFPLFESVQNSLRTLYHWLDNEVATSSQFNSFDLI